MDAIRHVANVRFFGKTTLVKVGEHLLRHPAVYAAHPVDFLGEPASENAHRELVKGVAIVFAPESHETLPCNVQQLGVIGEIGAHQIFGKRVMTGRHRGMGRVQ